MAIVREDVNSLSGLVTAVLGIASSLEVERPLWFRGMTCSTYTLLPKIMRDGKAPEQVFERETRLLTRFRQRSMPFWPSGYPQNDWEHLFAMQHYGMPTRLLDWTENLFVAAHFALSDPIPPHGHEGECVPVVWCLDPIGWNRSTPPLADFGDVIQVLTTVDDELEAYRPLTNKRRQRTPIAIYGAHNSNRIVAQRGTFMVWGNEVQPLEAFADSGPGTQLWSIRLVAPRDNMATEMRQIGFTETMVFPELPSLGVELSRTEGWRE